jgi:hypothetical protein
MFRGNRKTTPHVVRGRIQKKNNWDLSPSYYDAPHPRTVVIDRKRPGEGYRHLLNKSDIYRFLEILPDWDKIAVGLNAIVLAPGEDGLDGYHTRGVVHLCAWEAEMQREIGPRHYAEHREIFERLGVECEEMPDGWFLCKWHEESAQAYQLLHILLHELGHHHDRMTTRSQRWSSRGENFAEAYALKHESAIWDRYFRIFPY